MVEEAESGLRVLATPPGDDNDGGVVVDLTLEGSGQLVDVFVLLVEHVRDIDVAQIGDDQLEEELASQVTKTRDRNVDSAVLAAWRKETRSLLFDLLA